MSKKTNLYKQTDKYLDNLKGKIRTEFNYLSVLSFDELNMLNAKKITKKTYERLMAFNEKEYLKIIEHARKVACKLLGKEVKLDDYEVLNYVLNEPNKVTGYIYDSESDRKRMRTTEEMVTYRELSNREIYNKALNRSANLWYTQSAQYGIDIADKAQLETFKKAKVKKVMWNTENDQRVCQECMELDGKVFDIDKVPPKQHYRCRCYLTPVLEKRH